MKINYLAVSAIALTSLWGAASPAQESPAQDSTAQDSTAQDSTAQDSTAQDSTAQDSTAQDSTAQDSTAQDSPAREDKSRGDVITVTGTKLNTSLQDANVSVEVYTPERIDQERIIDLNDVLTKAPNVNSSGSAGSFSIRGIGRSGVSNAGRGVTSNVYVDGAPLSGFALGRGPTSLWDVGQIEVLRGSQSSVQGRNALAGGIIVNTNDPTYDYQGKGRFTYSRFDTIQAAAALSGPIIKDQLAVRFAVDYQSADGFIENIIADQNNDFRETLGLRGKVLLEPKALPGFSTKLSVDYIDADLGESRPSIASSFGTTSPELLDFDFFGRQADGRFVTNNNTTWRFVSESALELDEAWTARVIVTKEDTAVDRFFGLREDFDAFDGTAFNQFDADVFSSEVRFEFDYDSIRGLVGGYYFDQQDISSRDIQVRLLGQIQTIVAGLAPPLVPLVSLNPSDSILSVIDSDRVDTKNYAFFGQVEWDVSPQWKLNLGFRYDDEKFRQTDVAQESAIVPDSCLSTVPNAIVGDPRFGPFDPLTLPCAMLVNAFLGEVPADPVNANTFNAFLPRAALTYDITPDHSVFVSYQRGYRAGGSSIFSTPNPGGIGNIRVIGTYDPEFLKTVEVGTRNVFLGGQLVANANAFYSKYNDQQVTFTGDNPLDTSDDRVLNAGESTIYGLELSLDYTPNEVLNFYASVGLLNTEFDDFPFAPSGPFANLAGNEFPNAPDASFTIGTNYTHPSGIFANANFSYTSKQWAGIDNLDSDDFRQAFVTAGLSGDAGARFTERLNARSDLTARAGYKGDGFTLYGFATNLLNSKALTAINFGAVS